LSCKSSCLSSMDIRTACAGLLRDWVPHCAELRGSVCNGRPTNWLILRRSNFQLRPLIPPCGGSNPPAPAKALKHSLPCTLLALRRSNRNTGRNHFLYRLLRRAADRIGLNRLGKVQINGIRVGLALCIAPVAVRAFQSARNSMKRRKHL